MFRDINDEVCKPARVSAPGRAWKLPDQDFLKINIYGGFRQEERLKASSTKLQIDCSLFVSTETIVDYYCWLVWCKRKIQF